MLKKRTLVNGTATAILLSCLAPSLHAAPYDWLYPTPIKTPTPSENNGKTVLFDVSHGGTEGNADWVINGGFSDFSDALVAEGYTVKEYRGEDKNNDGRIQFVDDYSVPSASATAANEAVITFEAIKHADVFVLAESNRPFTLAEQTALEQFVASGKGIFFISDHYNADRNLNSWDSTEVFNGYNRSDLTRFNVGGAYGDLRNPGIAGSGWLAENFGLRFRFNAIDWKPGVSGLVSVAQSEGITRGAGPVLMAGGGTLSVVDPTRAKGLVYFSPNDRPTRWNHAVDTGLYFGGVDEGPYVAIAKSGRGKAAFIGDSSPIEDASPVYRRQDNGNSKKTYPGWTDSGNAAQLSVNIIDWLATPESYSHFNSATHPVGTLTNNPMAAQELVDPDNGLPWNSPSGGYNPWDPTTFADGSYAAPNPLGGATGGGSNGGTPIGSTLSVSDALTLSHGETVTVVGSITQAVNGIYALEIKDLQNSGDTILVKLESQYRHNFSPINDPSLVGQTLAVTGTLDSYTNLPSIEYVTDMQIVEIPAFSSVVDALTLPNGTEVTVEGVIDQSVNGEYALSINDLNHPETAIIVKLESEYRMAFSPINNPNIIGKTVRVTGTRDAYTNLPSIEYVSEMLLVDGSVGNDDGNTPSTCWANNAVDVETVSNSSVGSSLIAVGQVTGGINNPYALILSDIESATTIYVKLETEQRVQFSPTNNPSIVGEYIQVTGVRDLYMSYPSLEAVSDLTIQNGCP